MDWRDLLISLFVYVCQKYKEELWVYCQTTGCKRSQKLPVPGYIGITSGSEHDLNAFRETARNLHGTEIFADKAYIDRLEQEMPAQGQRVKLYSPVKKKKKQKNYFYLINCCQQQ